MPFDRICSLAIEKAASTNISTIPSLESERFREVPMICLRLRAPWLSLALLLICVGHASAQVPATLSASFNPSTVVAGGANTTVYEVTITHPQGAAGPCW